MSTFHSICVRVDGAIAHHPSNSHSAIIKEAGWTENDSVHKGKRFVECEWNGEGAYPGAEKISRTEGDELTAKQIKAVDLHYGNLALALKGDLDALAYFDKTKYLDVYNQVLELREKRRNRKRSVCVAGKKDTWYLVKDGKLVEVK